MKKINIQKVIRGICQKYREDGQIYNLIKSPVGSLLNMDTNVIFLMYHLKMNFAKAIVHDQKEINVFIRDAKVLLSHFDNIIVRKIMGFIKQKKAEDGYNDTFEAYSNIDPDEISQYIEDLFNALLDLEGVFTWMHDVRVFLDRVVEFLLTTFGNTEIYFQIKTLVHRVILSPTLVPIIPKIEVHIDINGDEGNGYGDIGG
ncbi:MAG: hypothetical protein ACOC5T_02065 [Elusimicrobiota bacterium]